MSSTGMICSPDKSRSEGESVLESRFSEQQFAFILRQSEEGTSVEEICCKAGEATYYNWRKTEA